jgi:outer membrane phospholipase A
MSYAWPQQNPGTPAAEKAPAAEKIDREDSSILERHYPFYFVYGEPLSKLQLCFKAPVLRGQNLYFAYTQVMFWALQEDSKPFRDLTYNPELFYRWETPWTLLKSIDFGLIGHTSNGRLGGESRSYDMNYLRFNTERTGHRWLTRMSAQVAYLHGFDPTNRDIQKYVSPLSLSISFVQLFDAWFDKSEVAFSAWPGGKFADKWGQGGYEVSWSFRLGAIKIVPAFYLQYYYGYAEALLNYDQHVREFRGGLIF